MFFTNYVNQCNKAGLSPSAAAEAMGFKRSVVTRWNHGVCPRQATLQKMADFFGCSVEALMADEAKKSPSGEFSLTDEEKRIILAWRLADEKSRNVVSVALADYMESVFDKTERSASAS